MTVRQIQSEFAPFMQVSSKHPYRHYIAIIFGIHQSPDGKWFAVEELLSRPLDRVGRIRDRLSFVRICRDLCRGLLVIHDAGLVHRDLKLDNLGLDQTGRAKIFDLGSITSDPKESAGSILSRAPELYRHEKRQEGEIVFFPQSADIWSLGACFFALRTGVYPFVTAREATDRRSWNDKFRDGAVSEFERENGKAAVDKAIFERRFLGDSEASLSKRISEEFRGEACLLMQRMLSFDVSARPSAEEAARLWGDIASEDSTTSVESSLSSDAKSSHSSLIAFVKAAVDGEIETTLSMRTKILSDFESGHLVLQDFERKELSFYVSKFKQLV